MKKLLLLLLCVPLIFSCGGNLDKEITKAMIDDGYTGKGTFTDSTGVEYVGEFKTGRMHGQGRLTIENVILEGLWEHNNFLGLKQTVIIQDGEKGVLLKYYDGLEKETIYESGKHTIAIKDNMIIYDVKTQTLAITVDCKDKNGVQVGLEMNILYNPIPDEIGFLHDEIGPNYLNKVIKINIKDIALRVVEKYTFDEMYDSIGETIDKAKVIQDTIEKMIKEELLSYHINIDILILDIIISEKLRESIKEYKNKLERLKEEQKYISEELEVINKKEQNSKVIIIGNGDGDLPIILGGQ